MAGVSVNATNVPIYNESLKERIEQITNLPTLPQVVSRLISIVNNPATSFSDVAFVVGQDLSLSAKVLRMANSAFYGMPRTIGTVANAVAILGLKVISTLVVSLTVFDMFPRESKRILFDRKAFWVHCLGCGIIARLFCVQLPKVVLFDAEEAFCAGLLHDIGKVVMEQYLHDDFHRALRTAARKGIPMIEAEQKVLGFTHTEVAAWLISRWGLPPELMTPIVYHHDPFAAPDNQDIAMLCHLADNVCYEMGLSLAPEYAKPPLDARCAEHLMLSERFIASVKEQVPEELKKTEVFYEIAQS
jgi:putative nucleotidyltransferase with HDIG domain